MVDGTLENRRKMDNANPIKKNNQKLTKIKKKIIKINIINKDGFFLTKKSPSQILTELFSWSKFFRSLSRSLFSHSFRFYLGNNLLKYTQNSNQQVKYILNKL